MLAREIMWDPVDNDINLKIFNLKWKNLNLKDFLDLYFKNFLNNILPQYITKIMQEFFRKI